MIDMQNSMFMGPNEYPYLPDETLAAARSVLDRAREAGAPVIHIQHQHARYEPMQPGHIGFEIHPTVAPIEGETVIVKRSSDAFDDTALDATLRDLGVETIVVGGMQTQHCVDTSCRRALGLGYDMILIADGHTTFDTEDLPASSIIAHHAATLADLAHARHEIIVRPSAEIVFEEGRTDLTSLAWGSRTRRGKGRRAEKDS